MIILFIETASRVCSVCLTEGDRILAFEENHEERSHSRTLVLLIRGVLAKAGLSVTDLDGVVVSKGVGSYTGLRIGFSTAKGICYGQNIPLYGVSTLESLAWSMHQKPGLTPDDLIIPILDARRMEVYAAHYDIKMNLLKEDHAWIVNEESVNTLLENAKGRIYIVGDAVDKLKSLLIDARFELVYEECDSRFLIPPGLKAVENGESLDLAYSKPFYLKPPNITTPKKLPFG